MGFLDRLFGRGHKPRPVQLQGGSFSVDPQGRVISSTLPASFSRSIMDTVSKLVLDTFRLAHTAQLRAEEFTVHYGTFKITARSLRSGAIIFLVPRPHLDRHPPTPQPLPLAHE